MPEEGPLKGTLLLGDSLLRYSGDKCSKSGAVVDMNPGAKISHIKEKLITYSSDQLDLIYLFVGTNDLVINYNGGPGYNGGWGKKLRCTPWLTC